MHTKKNEKISMARAEALIQMSIHGDKTRGTGRKEMRRHKKVVFSGRRKEICPLCDRVQKYLSTHLRRYHQLDNESEQYKTAMRIARPYEGVHSEIQWDFHLNPTTKKTRPTRGAESQVCQLPVFNIYLANNVQIFSTPN